MTDPQESPPEYDDDNPLQEENESTEEQELIINVAQELADCVLPVRLPERHGVAC